MKTIRCVADHIMVIPADPKDRTHGGILLPTSMLKERHEKAFYGRVISCGPKVEQVHPDDLVIFDVHRSESRVLDGPPNKKAVLVFFIREDAVFQVWSKEAALAWDLEYPQDELKPFRDLIEMVEDHPTFKRGREKHPQPTA